MMRIHTNIIFTSLIMLALWAPANTTFAQTKPDVEEELKEIAQEEKEEINQKTIFSFAIENDLFGIPARDNNYTNGARLSWFRPGATPPALFEKIDDYIPTFDVNETTSIHYSIGQNLYTPDDISIKNPENDERPYAGFLYGSAGLMTAYDNHIDEIELTLGIVGPWALGEETQKLVHELIDTTHPEGWDNHQLKNEPALMFSAQRRWPQFYEANLPGSLVFTTSPYTGATIGNVYTYANTGIDFRLRPKRSEWDDTPLRVRPSMPGTGYFQSNKFDWYLFAGLDGRAIGQNIFLDGNSFRDSPRVDKKYFVGDANIGVAFTLGNVRVSYTLVYRSKEFETQKKPTSFGAFSIGYRF